MTAMYWSRKLEGGCIQHKGTFKSIEALRANVPDDAKVRFKYPEDYLPYIEFRLNDGESVNFNDIKIIQPEERYVRVGGKVVWGARNMARNYLLAPSTSSYTLDRGEVTLLQWLNAPTPRYVGYKNLLVWGKAAIFSRDLCAKDIDKYRRALYCGGVEVLRLCRTADKVTVHHTGGVQRDRLVDGLGVFPEGYLSKTSHEYTWPKADSDLLKEIKNKPAGIFRFEWDRVDGMFADNGGYEYRVVLGIGDKYIHVCMVYDEYVIRDQDDVIMDTPEEYHPDLLLLLEQENMI